MILFGCAFDEIDTIQHNIQFVTEASQISGGFRDESDSVANAVKYLHALLLPQMEQNNIGKGRVITARGAYFNIYFRSDSDVFITVQTNLSTCRHNPCVKSRKKILNS